MQRRRGAAAGCMLQCCMVAWLHVACPARCEHAATAQVLYYDEIFDEDMAPGSPWEIHSWFSDYVSTSRLTIRSERLESLMQHALHLISTFNGTRATSNLEPAGERCALRQGVCTL